MSVPRHVAVIMDGNGRWARKRGLPGTAGHRAGSQALRKLVPEAAKMGIRHLTVYAFSTENWKRSPEEVEGLMRLLREYIQRYIEENVSNDYRMSVIGDLSRLDPDLQRSIRTLSEESAGKRGLHLQIALNYGGRDELVRAAQKLARQVQQGTLAPEEIDEAAIAAQLDTFGCPEPELLIRTGGVVRLSNFLLWQAAYTEIYVTDKLWPDFSPRDLREALRWFGDVERRFGAR